MNSRLCNFFERGCIFAFLCPSRKRGGRSLYASPVIGFNAPTIANFSSKVIAVGAWCANLCRESLHGTVSSPSTVLIPGQFFKMWHCKATSLRCGAWVLAENLAKFVNVMSTLSCKWYWLKLWLKFFVHFVHLVLQWLIMTSLLQSPVVILEFDVGHKKFAN